MREAKAFRLGSCFVATHTCIVASYNRLCERLIESQITDSQCEVILHRRQLFRHINLEDLRISYITVLIEVNNYY